MTSSCACRCGAPARAQSLLCPDCYRLGCEEAVCHRECPNKVQHALAFEDDAPCCHGTGRVPLDHSTARSGTEYRSVQRAEDDYEDEMRRRDEEGS